MNDLTARYDGTMERTPEGGVIRFERALPYRIEDVWDAITNPDRLADWWLPFDADISVDLRPGGALVFAGRSEGEPTMSLAIHRVEAPTLLEHTHVDEGSLMRWELEPTDAGCVLRISHFVVDPALASERGYIVGLHTSLSRLVPLLEGRPIAWDWDAFAYSQAQYALLGLAPATEEIE